MPALERKSGRIVIAGASSLLGAELKSLLEESRFAGWDIRLVDEELAAGTLTEAAGEPVVRQPVEQDTFRGARFAFFGGSAEFAKRCAGPAHAAGATIIDFSHMAFSDPDAAPWFPAIEVLTGRQISKDLKTYAILSAPGAAIASVGVSLRKHGLRKWKVRLRDCSHFRVLVRKCLACRRRSTPCRATVPGARWICGKRASGFTARSRRFLVRMSAILFPSRRCTCRFFMVPHFHCARICTRKRVLTRLWRLAEIRGWCWRGGG